MLCSTEKQHERRSVTTSQSTHSCSHTHSTALPCVSRAYIQPHVYTGRTDASDATAYDTRTTFRMSVTLHSHVTCMRTTRVCVCARVCACNCRHHDSLVVSFTRTQMSHAGQVTYFSFVSIWHARLPLTFYSPFVMCCACTFSSFRMFSVFLF